MGFNITRVNLYIPQGDTYGHSFLFRDPDTDDAIQLVSYTARMQIRERVTGTEILYEATTDEGDGLTVTGATGKVYLEIPAATTKDWTFTKGVYDLEVVSPTGNVTKIARGNVKVLPEVTR